MISIVIIGKGYKHGYSNIQIDTEIDQQALPIIWEFGFKVSN